MENRQRFCEQCGAKLKEGAKFCNQCGQQVRQEATGGASWQRKRESWQASKQEQTWEHEPWHLSVKETVAATTGGKRRLVPVLAVAIAAACAVGGLAFVKIHKGAVSENAPYETGDWNGNVYKNTSLGVKFSLPEEEGWESATSEELEEMEESTDNTADCEEAYYNEDYGCAIFIMTRDNEENLTAQECAQNHIENLETQNELLRDILDVDYYYDINDEANRVRLGATEFSHYCYDMVYEDGDETLAYNTYITIKGDNVVEMIMVCDDSSGEDACADIINSIQKKL